MNWVIPIIFILLFLFVLIAIHTTVGFGIFFPKKKVKKKTVQVNNRGKNSLYKGIEKKINEKAGTAKRYKKEKIYLQAGVKITYAQGVILGLVIGVVAFIGAQILLDNLLLSTFIFVIGFILPDQAINFMKNKREKVINEQVGTFFSMIMKRYEVIGDFYMAFLATEEDFKGEDPMYSEIVRAKLNIQNGMPLPDALKDMANRLENKYLGRFADYYEVAAEIGTEESRNNILYQAVEQYNKNEEDMRVMRKQLSEVTMEAYVMLAFVPIVVVYSCFTQPSYLEFVTTTLMGKVGIAVIAIAVVLIFWFINAKIGAPLDKD